MSIEPEPMFTDADLAVAVREAIDFMDIEGWDSPPRLFALVDTAELLASQPELASELGDAGPLTAIAQDTLPSVPGIDRMELDGMLAHVGWPEEVLGCVLVHEITLLPPGSATIPGGEGADDDSREEVPDAPAPRRQLEELQLEELDADEEALWRAAETHPDRRPARLAVGVLRDGSHHTLIELRGEDDGFTAEDDIVEFPEFSPALIAALVATLED